MDKLSILYRVPMPRSIYGMFRKELGDCDSVLDVGCGIDSILLRLGFNHVAITGLDIWERYAIKHKKDVRYHNYLCADIMSAEFASNSFDMVLLSDTLEHLSKVDVYNEKLFDRMALWARKRVVIMTPRGFIGNESYDGNPHLYHKSGWYTSELEALGFKVYCTLRVRRKVNWEYFPLELFRTLFAVREV